MILALGSLTNLSGLLQGLLGRHLQLDLATQVEPLTTWPPGHLTNTPGHLTPAPDGRVSGGAPQGGGKAGQHAGHLHLLPEVPPPVPSCCPVVAWMAPTSCPPSPTLTAATTSSWATTLATRGR